MIIEHYYRFIPNLTRQDGSAFDKAAAQFGLWEQRCTAEKRQKLRQKLKEVTGSICIIEQVKAYRPGHKVPADDVRALLGVLSRDQNVSKGIVTTTSMFAPGIEEEMKLFIPNRLELKDGPRTGRYLPGHPDEVRAPRMGCRRGSC